MGPPSGCCMLEVEGFVIKVNDPSVVLFDVLAAVDAFGVLLTAAAVLGFCLLGMKTCIFQERVLKQESQVSQVPQVVPQQVQLPLREVFPECWERNRVDLARISAKIGVPHSILCNIAFEQNMEEMSVDEVRAAARSLVASEPVGEEGITQAAAAPPETCGQGQGKRKRILKRNGALHRKVSKRCS